MNIVIKLITSLPVILIIMYFIPILGIILSIFKIIAFKNKRLSFSIALTIIGVLLFIFDRYDLQEYVTFVNLFEYDILNYSKSLIILGVCLILSSYVLTTISSKLHNGIFKYINKLEQMDYEISSKNDMKMKIKQEKARNTHHVKCPSCGADNLVSDKISKCKYCRKNLVNKKYKE